MSVYYYLYARGTKECAYLGPKSRRSDHEYQGPVIFIEQDRYFLPAQYIDRLIERFRNKHHSENVIICPEYELFDTELYLPQEEDFIEVGGEREFDIPLTDYLPELKDEQVLQSIATHHPELKIT